MVNMKFITVKRFIFASLNFREFAVLANLDT